MTITPADALDLRIAQGPPVSNLGEQIANIPNAYWAGLDEAYKRRTQDAFKNGVPLDAGGQPDLAAIGATALTKGGVSAVPSYESLANLGLQRQQLELGQRMSGQMGAIESPTGQAPLSVPQIGTIPAGAQSNSVAPPLRPSAAVPNSDTSILSAVAPFFGDENAVKLGAGIAARLKVGDMNAPLSPEQFDQAKQMAQTAAANRGRAQPTTGPVPPAQMGAPARGSPPTTQDPETQQQIARYTQILSNPALASLHPAAKLRLEALQKKDEPTGPVKEYDLARRQGYTGTFQQFQNDNAGDQARAKAGAGAFVKRYETITETGSRALQEIPQLQLAQKLMDDPRFYSGAGENYNLALKRIAVALGASSEEAAAPQEAFRKIVSGSILQGLKGLQGVGQIRVAEINLLKNAAASSENTPAANRILLTSAQRLNERNAAIADMAQKYKGGNIDSGFDRQVAEYDRSHPMFSDKELGDFRNIISGAKGGATSNVSDGATATNPKTGERLILRNGKWEPHA